VDNYQLQCFPSKSNTMQAQFKRLFLTWQPERYPESCAMYRIHINSSTKTTALNFPTRLFIDS